MINRFLHSEVLRLSKGFKVVAVTGPRQSGKTTLCRMAFPDYDYFNLENPLTVAEIAQNPIAFLELHATKGVIFDEAQKYPELFSYIQEWLSILDASYEIKSATAFHSDFTNNLDYLKRLLGDTLIKTQVIYDGNSHLDTVENGIVNFRRIEF